MRSTQHAAVFFFREPEEHGGADAQSRKSAVLARAILTRVRISELYLEAHQRAGGGAQGSETQMAEETRSFSKSSVTRGARRGDSDEARKRDIS
jgi:hypothetical protein